MKISFIATRYEQWMPYNQLLSSLMTGGYHTISVI